MSYLYLCEHGAVIGIEGGYFKVVHKDKSETRIPKETLEAIALFGNNNLTTPCVEECLKRDIPVSFFSANGAYFGRLESTRHSNIFRQKKQIYLSDDPKFCLEFSKSILTAKTKNQVTILRRYMRTTRTDVNDEITFMLKNIRKIETSENSDVCKGYEGLIAREYFSALAKMVPEEFKFKGRNKQPPRDAFNSMLSLGYTMLMYEIYGEIENAGLTPYAGFLHKDRERHPTLASDLMEEWRAVLIDSVVLSLVVGREISIEEFWNDENTGGVFLSHEAMKTFLKKYELKMRQNTKYIEEAGKSFSSYRQVIRFQVQKLVHMIMEHDVKEYHPIIIR